MPAITRYITNRNDKGYQGFEERWRNEFNTRREEIAASQKLYDGIFPDVLSRDGSQVDDNIKVPLITLLIDKDNAAMLGTDDKGSIQGISYTSETEDIQTALDELWIANKKNLFHLKLFRNASIGGHVFIKLQPQGRTHQKKKVPRFINLNPANVGVGWAEDDLEMVIMYRIEYEQTRQDIVRHMDEANQPLMGWTIFDYTRKSTFDSNWKLVKSTEWNYEFPPMVDWQNQPDAVNYYGKNDIGILGNLNIAYNFGFSAAARTVKHKAGAVTTANFPLVDADGEAFELAPDRILEIPIDGKVEVVEVSGDVLKPTMDFANVIRRAFFDSGRELDPATVQDRLGELTNFALRVLHQDTLAKRQNKWLTAGEGLENLMRYALVLEGKPFDSLIQITPPDPLPQNPMEQQAAISGQIQLGLLSKTTAQQQLGLDPETEINNLINEEVQADLMSGQTGVGVSG